MPGDGRLGPSDTVAILQPFGIWSIGSIFLDSVAQLGATGLPLGIHLSDEDALALICLAQEGRALLSGPSRQAAYRVPSSEGDASPRV